MKNFARIEIDPFDYFTSFLFTDQQYVFFLTINGYIPARPRASSIEMRSLGTVTTVGWATSPRTVTR
jgi:hypothetical protein